MARNTSSTREPSKRQHGNKKYNDYFCETNKKTKISNTSNGQSESSLALPCKGCELVFRNERALMLHQAKCLTVTVDLSNQGSFFNITKQRSQGNIEIEDVDKILPPSQPLGEYKFREPPKSYAAVVSSPAIADTGILSDETQHVETTPNFSEGVVNLNETPCLDEEATLSSTKEFVDPQHLPNLPPYTECSMVPTQSHNGIDGATFTDLIECLYEDAVKWRKNHFQVPSGHPGKQYINLKTKWLKYFNTDSCFKGIAFKVLSILPGLLLQKPSQKSKTKEHTKLLGERLKYWEEGKINDLWKETKTIQSKLSASRQQKSDKDITRIFSKLMFEGKVGPALKFLENQYENSVLSPTEDVVTKLQSLHPEPAEILPNTLLQGPLEEISPAYFYTIDEDQIFRAANATKGSGGPSQEDAQQWRRILCSSKFKAEGKELREELAIFARKIATEVVDPRCLEAYVAGRLIPLNKNPGEENTQIRPIGVGEVMRRIIGKALSWCLSTDIQAAAGPLQVSAGVKGGAEAAIHAMKNIFELEATDAVILVDAANAFNSLNRAVSLHNMRYLCPPFATVLINTYRIPTRLFITGGGEIKSSEGTTQGDTLAMPDYGISVTPIIDHLKRIVEKVSQVWLADDATGAGKLNDLKTWWVQIIEEGKKFGYHVKPSKSWLILKNPDLLQETEILFHDHPINITTTGKRHLGAALGSQEFKNSYIDEKVSDWCKRLLNLSEIAKSQPHAAYTAFIHGEQHRYTYFMRTIGDITENLKPLDRVLDEVFIPALFGDEITVEERELISIQVKEGGLGIREVSKNSLSSYETSKEITAPLIMQIINQSDNLPNVDDVRSARSVAMLKVKEKQEQTTTEIKTKQTLELQRKIEQISEPGASSWLSALPLTQYGFDLSKAEFHDALNLRYNKRLKNMPTDCVCGRKYTITHALNCKNGGFLNARHDNIRDLEARMLKNVCNDVEIEPTLQPVTNTTNFSRSANVSEEARLDIRSRGFWRPGQNAFFDVRVTNADCDSQVSSTINSVLRKHEMEKKRQYNQRVMEIEHGTFTPLIFTTSGAMGHECTKFHKSLAEKMSIKNGEKYDDIMRYIRVKISFLVLKATLLCIRGSRTLKKMNIDTGGEDFSQSLRELGL